jgi:hypothetical protein
LRQIGNRDFAHGPRLLAAIIGERRLAGFDLNAGGQRGVQEASKKGGAA